MGKTSNPLARSETNAHLESCYQQSTIVVPGPLRPLRSYAIGSAVLFFFCVGAAALGRSWHLPSISEPWFNALAQLGATLVGASIALSTTWRFERKAAKERDQSKALSAMTKMMEIGNNLHSIRLLLDQTLIEANSQNRTDEPLWMRIKPTVSVPKEVTFEAGDLQPFYGNDNKLPTRMVLIAQRHNSVLSTLTFYNALSRTHRDHIRQLADEGLKVPLSGQIRRQELQELAISLLSQTREFLGEVIEVAGLFNAISKRNKLGVLLTLGDYDRGGEA